MLYQDFNIYVDMAVEARDLIRGATDQEIPGKRRHRAIKTY